MRTWRSAPTRSRTCATWERCSAGRTVNWTAGCRAVPAGTTSSSATMPRSPGSPPQQRPAQARRPAAPGRWPWSATARDPRLGRLAGQQHGGGLRRPRLSVPTWGSWRWKGIPTPAGGSSTGTITDRPPPPSRKKRRTRCPRTSTASPSTSASHARRGIRSQAETGRGSTRLPALGDVRGGTGHLVAGRHRLHLGRVGQPSGQHHDVDRHQCSPSSRERGYARGTARPGRAPPVDCARMAATFRAAPGITGSTR